MSGSAGSDRPLSRDFFDRPVLDVAPDLLGRTLVRYQAEGEIRIRLTEVEAYDGERDPGSHAYRGRTRRNATMYGPPGHAYVYFTYGMWHCANLVCGPPGEARGVLLRAGEVLAGVELARSRRPSSRVEADLARGPARLATALALDRTHDGADVCGGPELGILHGEPPPRELVRTGPRTGIRGEGAVPPWRFWVHADPTVSPYRAHPRNTRPAKTAELDGGGTKS